MDKSSHDLKMEPSRPLSPALGREEEVFPHSALRLAPAKTPSIADALILKDCDLFLVTRPNGDIPLDPLQATGLYYHDCRFLDGYELRAAGYALETLVSTAARGYQSLVELTNPELLSADGTVLAPLESVAIKWMRTLDCQGLALHDSLSIRNLGRVPVSLPLSLRFHAGFQDVFQVRSLECEPLGRLLPPHAQGRELLLEYEGSDDFTRRVTITFEEAPDCWEPVPGVPRAVSAGFLVELPPRAERVIALIVGLEEEVTSGTRGVGHFPTTGAALPASRSPVGVASPAAAVPRETGIRGAGTSPAAAEPGAPARPPRRVSAALHDALSLRHNRAETSWRQAQTRVSCDSLLLGAIIERSFRDLYLLRSNIGGEQFYAAGVPWFGTLFGRDSVITALQTLPYDPRIARQTLLLLAAYQGNKEDPRREEEPGKILHELRVGELARTERIPHTPYYGSADVTPLFLILAAEYFAWTADVETLVRLEPHLAAALRWLEVNQDKRGYLTYGAPAPGGLVNQGWKDSDDGVPQADGFPAEPPIAMVEVQAYAYAARVRLAQMYRELGKADRAQALEEAAAALRDRFNRDFWMENRGCYALALAGARASSRGKEPLQVRVCTSNAGHALWAGIATPEQARRVRKRLLKPDMFTGWGIRTLSANEMAYSPVGYHLGTVWPHDNALIAAGFRCYGFDKAALRVFHGLTRAAMYFELYRLPELFSGFSREEYEVPVPYPLASKPQAWAAGAVPYLLAELLGLRPEASRHRLNVVSPVLPEYVDWLELEGLRVGASRVDLRFERTRMGVAVEVRRKDEPIEVIVKL